MPTTLSSERDRAVLRSFASRIDRGDAGAHNNLGVLYFNKGMVAEAVAEFTRALDLDPKMTIAQRNLEIAYFTSGYYDERVATLRARLEQSPDDGSARWELGRTYTLLGEAALAVDQFAAIVRDDPTDVRAMLQLALAEAKRGDQESAARWLSHALEIEPDNATLHFHLGEASYHRGLNDEALAQLQRAIALAPDDADAHYLLGFVLGDIGRHEDARASTRRAFQLNPSLGRAHANLSLERFDAQSYARAREVREARGLGDPLEVAEEGQLAHFNLGLAFRQKGYHAEALREYRLALDRGEDRLLVLQAMAEVHLLRQESTEAVALYDRLLQELPNSPKLWNERGVSLHQAGRVSEALESYARAVECDAHYVIARNNLAVALAHDGAAERALAEFGGVLADEPSFQKGRLNLALLLFRESEYVLSLDAYARVLAADPAHPVALNGTGLVLVQMQRVEEARNAFARAIEARDDYAEAHYNLGFALSALGDYAGSLRETKHALELDPYYAPQRFELAVDLEFEDPRFEVAAELGGDTRPESLQGFAFEEQALDSLFGNEGVAPEAPVRERPLEGRVEALMDVGASFMERGATGEAIERFREARGLAPERRDAVLAELRALVSLGRHREGGALAREVAAWQDADAEALIVAATILAESDAAEEVPALLERARQGAPADPAILQGIGDVARSLGDAEGAIEAYRAALARDGGFAAVRVQLAGLLRGLGRHEAAEGELVAALREFPQYAEGALALAALRRELGRAHDGIAVLIPILEANPWHLDALASLGESLFLSGQLEDARFAVARVLRFDPEHVAAIYVDAVLMATSHRYEEAIGRWERMLELEPVGEYARRARRDMRAAHDAIEASAAYARAGSIG